MKARGSLTARLGRLEERAADRTAPESEPRDEAEWLAAFEDMARDGVLDAEPDFPRALALGRTALTGARASVDPPFDPPAHFMPGHPNPRLRSQSWRSAARFPELTAVLNRLFEIVGRAVEGEPSVTEAEFAELAAWFAAHDAELAALGALECEDGRFVWHMNVRYDLTHGSRAIGARRVAEDVRRLRARLERDTRHEP